MNHKAFVDGRSTNVVDDVHIFLNDDFISFLRNSVRKVGPRSWITPKTKRSEFFFIIRIDNITISDALMSSDIHVTATITAIDNELHQISISVVVYYVST